MIQREVYPDGTLQIHSAACRYTFIRLRPGTLFLRIQGREIGDLGRAPLGEVAVEAALHPPLRLLIDMTDLSHVTEAVSRDWTAWFQAHRQTVQRVDVLVPEVFVRLVVSVSQLFSRTGNMIRIHTDAESFARVVGEVAPTFEWSLPDG